MSGKEGTDSKPAPVIPRPASYRPSAWYWRKDIREAKTKAEVQAMALALVEELETHKAAIRALGFIPPKTRLSPSEAAAKPHLVKA